MHVLNFVISLLMSEVTFSASSYMQMRHLLTPKHLQLAPTKRKQQMKQKFLLQPPAVSIRQSKMQFLRPLKEIQKIMRHFDAKFEKEDFGHHIKKLRKRPSSSLVAIQHPDDKKISELINLPTLKGIKQRAQSYKNAINAEQINERNQKKQKIMDQFQTYLNAELKIHPKSSFNRVRVHTYS